MVALVVVALIGSLLAVTAPVAVAPAGAQTTSTHTQWMSDCAGRAGGISQQQVEPLGFTVDHPTQVAPDEEFTFRVIPDEGYLPDTTTSPALPGTIITVFGLRLTNMMFNLPANAEFVSAEIVPDTTYNTAGPYSVGLDESFTPARIVLFTQEVVKNPDPELDNDTPFKYPSFDVTVKATGPIGSNVSTRMSGFNENTSGYTFTADNSSATATVRCWAEGNVPSPILFQTAILSGGGESQPTTTQLTVDPTLLPGGDSVTMTATVTAPGGVVRFNDGSTVLGLAELDADGVATLTAPLNNIGERPLVAHYLGAPSFQTSISDPVLVTVTDPSDRVPVQLAVTLNPASVNASSNGLAGNGSVSVSVTPTGGDGLPTGSVGAYLDGVLIGTQPLADGVAAFPARAFALGGHQVTAKYSGDIDYEPGWGSAPQVVVNLPILTVSENPHFQFGGGLIQLNGVSGSVPTGSSSSYFSASFRTDDEGRQTMDTGTLVFGETTLALAGGGSITGRLAQRDGLTSGAIDNVWNGNSWDPGAAASLSAELFFQATSVDFGSGAHALASTCAVGPFGVELEGTRAGTNGVLTLTGEGFSVPFPAAGTCIDSEGESLAGPVGAAFAGGQTEISLQLTPPAAPQRTVVSPVTVSLPEGSSFGQPVTLTASVSRLDGANLPVPGIGAIEFYANGLLLGSANTGAAVGSPSKSASITVPRGGSSAIAPLPVGTVELEARYVPNVGNKYNFASSAMSSPTEYTVLPPIEKQTPSLELDVVESANAGEPVTITVIMDPAPNVAPGTAQLAGSIKIYDRAEPSPDRQLIATTAGNNGMAVSASSGGTYSTQTALAPGVHELEAVFEPALESQWGWTSSTSALTSHTVVGEVIPTELTVVSDSTRGTGILPIGSSGDAGWVEVQLDPRVAATVGPFPASLNVVVEGVGTVPVDVFDASGRATAPISAFQYTQEPGPIELIGSFDPALWDEVNQTPLSPGNQGFARSETRVPFEVVDPAVYGALPTGTEIVSVNPSVVQAGETWSQVNGYVTYGAAGSVAYTARNVSTAVVTGLGSVAVSNTTNEATGRGLARLSNPAVTASLPAGTYEVRGSFTPTNPAAWQASQSDVFIVHVVDEAVVTETVLSVSPAVSSSPGQGVVLEATVSPAYASAGNVEFFAGEVSMGSAPTGPDGVASLLSFDLAEGEHSLSAVFTPADDLDATSSESDPVSHTVATPTTPTETVLTVTPEGVSDEGDPVTLTATVTPSNAVGDVVFEDESGELGSVVLSEGSAELVLADLPPGTHELQAIFEPDPESDFETSASEVVEHEVIAENTPGAPLDVSATGGGLMATVSWDAPEDDGGSAITGYTVYVEDSAIEVEVTADVTTVDVLGLSAGTNYSFVVTAWNANGESDPSAESNTVTVGEAQEFPDVQPGHPFFAEITWMAEVGLSTGFTDGEYKPNLTLTRQAMSAFLYRLNGSPDGADPECTVAPFPDVPVSNPFCGEIAWMAEEGISEGYDDGTYRPEDGLTRQAMSAFLYRSANGSTEPPPCSTPPFSDVPTTNEFCPEIAWMADSGISEGWPDGTYRPMEDLTRQAMSAFLYRYTLVVQTVIV